jgi:HPt (histidine-containing phosphotransfer) domain-containing protein
MPSARPDMTGRPDIVLDIERLTENCNGNREIVTELLGHLCNVSGPKWLRALEKGIQSKDSGGIRETCHGMKGACVTIFAWRLSNMAFEFEYLARDGDITGIAGRMGEMRQAFREMEDWLAAKNF